MVKNPAANAGDTGLSSGSGGNNGPAEQLNLCASTTEPGNRTIEPTCCNY